MNFRRFLLTATLAVAFVITSIAPTQTHAASLDDSQIQAITTLLAYFGADANIIAKVEHALRSKVETIQSGTQSTWRHPICKRILGGDDTAATLGTRGDLVQELQDFLTSQGLLKTSVTGFFGPLTEYALGRWQVRVGIVGSADAAGWGVFGPITRERIKQWCNNEIVIATTDPRPSQSELNRQTIDNKSPIISGISGPTTLKINQAGTWSVSASDPENDALSYRIMWGDEWPEQILWAVALGDKAFAQNSSFTHAYNSAGVYVVNVLVRDSVGKQASIALTVNVGSETTTNCTLEYTPVCAQPPEPACRHAVPACALPMPGPQTYSNKCFLNSAGATFLYQGQCKTNPPPIQPTQPQATATSCTTSGGATYASGQNLPTVTWCQQNGPCPLGLNYSGAMTCSNGQWIPQTQTTGSSCVVQRHCGDLVVPNGGIAGNSKGCGVMCPASQCVNGAFVRLGTYATPHQYETSCPDDPISL